MVGKKTRSDDERSSEPEQTRRGLLEKIVAIAVTVVAIPITILKVVFDADEIEIDIDVLITIVFQDGGFGANLGEGSPHEASTDSGDTESSWDGFGADNDDDGSSRDGFGTDDNDEANSWTGGTARNNQ